MNNFEYGQKMRFEKLFKMKEGYVLDFTTKKEFRDFIYNAVKVDIYNEKYICGTNSMANRLRGFWKKEDNYNISRLLEKLLKRWKDKVESKDIEYINSDKDLYEECLRIVSNLKSKSPVKNLDALKPDEGEKDHAIFEEIERMIKDGHPERAIDRLHTFTTSRIKTLCNKNQIETKQQNKKGKHKPLHSLFGEYVKSIEVRIDSGMTKTVLKHSISILEEFNHVRNNKSFAHDNELLNRQESLYILNSIANLINFVRELDKNLNN